MLPYVTLLFAGKKVEAQPQACLVCPFSKLGLSLTSSRKLSSNSPVLHLITSFSKAANVFLKTPLLSLCIQHVDKLIEDTNKD